jgi:arylsulfatase A-like enzyme
VKAISSPTNDRSGQVLVTAAWFGVVTGLIEGCGLLLFQTLNGENWALHVSLPIIWISMLVDLILFSILALLVSVIALFSSKLSAVRAVAVLLVGLAMYDFLTLSARINSRGRILLALGIAVAFRRWLVKHDTSTRQFFRKSLPWVMTAGLLVFVVISGSAWLTESRALAHLSPAAPDSPNVLVIVVDTLRADHLSSYGYARPTTPNIDRLANEGVLFDNAVSASSWTYPSHVSLVTGRDTFEHGAGQIETITLLAANKSSFGGYPTIGEVLQEHGYRTGAFSANRFYFIGNAGFHRGFIHFEDYYDSPADMFARTLPGKELLRLYGKWFPKRMTVDWSPYGTNYGIRKRADEVNRELLRWIDQGGPHPFFTFLNYMDVHDPHGAPPSYPKLSAGASNVDRYDDSVRYTDDYIGRLLHSLQQRGLDKNTLVILTSDHGESLGEHGFQGHSRLLYWGLIHVPLVVRYPGHVPTGIHISTPVTNVAIPATITKLLGTDQDKKFPGPSLSLLWNRPESADHWPDPISEIAEDKKTDREDAALEGKFASSKNGPLKSLITSRWHLIVHKKFGDQLYDWVNDPAESNNLASRPAGVEIIRDLMAKTIDAFTGFPGQLDPASATTLHSGTLHVRRSQMNGSHQETLLNDYYRIQAEGGSKITIAVESAHPKSGKQTDPVVSVQDASGRLYQTCRNSGDDHIKAPGIADPTPEDFDDVCVNDDIVPGVDTNSRLEILVPGRAGLAVDLYVRVSDWNGSTTPNVNYQIAVGSSAPHSEQ